jgi:hypothetical protein
LLEPDQAISFVSGACNDDDRDPPKRRIRAQGGERVEATKAWHRQIEEKDINPRTPEELKRPAAIRSG